MDPKIIVVGSANTDFVIQVPELPSGGESVLGDHFRVVRGGKGANQAVAAARLGGKVTFIARLGTDGFGDDALAAYQHEGIRTDYIVREKETPSGVALIMVNRKGENVIAIAPGTNGHLTAADVLAAEAVFQGAHCLLVQLEVPLPAVQAAVELAHRSGVRVILNPAPAQKLPAGLLAMVDYLTPNQSEAALLASTDPSMMREEFLAGLPSKIQVPNLVVTLGSKGACYLASGKRVNIPAFKVNPVDTTACGDAFNGALAVALSKGISPYESILYANAAGALAATRHGAQPSLPTGKELASFISSTAASQPD
jgi:ribokinase